MAKTTIRLKMNKIPNVIPALEGLLTTAIHKTTLDIEAHAAANTPVDTGALKNSRQTELGPMSGRIFWGAAHAVPVHEGTFRMAARPFAADAAAKVEPGFQEALKNLNVEGAI